MKEESLLYVMEHEGSPEFHEKGGDDVSQQDGAGADGVAVTRVGGVGVIPWCLQGERENVSGVESLLATWSETMK
ncbi:hypothetical protein E2C01_082082 [Portunus trituberculatus]|uniref:Uncharacterized protein n=1 Tax=Portunus trituberculatus TaxID=210409 RepID=A0A5B7IZU7_PORTR|nr:hypothetical protein [Portunus trituberculatus]